MEEENRVDLDEFFPFVGEYGKYQKLLTWLIVLPACIPCGLQGFNQLFMSDDVDHWCKWPSSLIVEKGNFTEDQLKDLLLPRDAQGEMSKCFIRNINWSTSELFGNRKLEYEEISPTDFFLRTSWNENDEVLEDLELHFMSVSNNSITEFQERRNSSNSSVLNSTDNIEENSKDLIISCPNGWQYDISVDQHISIVADFDLVCGKEIYPTIALFLVNFGGLCGVFLFGILTDLIGRKLSFFVCLTFEMIGGIGCVFAKDFWTWTLFRVINGLTVPAIYQIPFIICLELVGQNYRSFVTVMTCLFYVGGMMLLPLIAYFERDWRFLSIWTTVPFVLYYVYYWFLPESPRWLLAKNRTKEALDILEKLARVNGTTLPEHLVQKITLQKANCSEEKQGKTVVPGLKELFATPNMRLKTILLTFCWFANATVYVGLSFYGPSLGENSYLSFFLGSAIEIPGYLLCWLVMDRFGRRWPLCLCMIIGGVFDIATVLLPEGSSTLVMMFYLIAKLGISASYLMVYPFGGELYPTEVRGIGLGFSAYIGGIGICCIPLINYLGRAHLLMPLIVMGVVSVIGGVVVLRIPETLHASLPTTIAEGEEFGKNFTWADFIHCGPVANGQSFIRESSHFVLETEAGGESIEMSGIKVGEMANQGLESEMHPLKPPTAATAVGQRRKRLVRQGSTLEAPTDSKGAIIITPWW